MSIVYDYNNINNILNGKSNDNLNRRIAIVKHFYSVMALESYKVTSKDYAAWDEMSKEYKQIYENVVNELIKHGYNPKI